MEQSANDDHVAETAQNTTLEGDSEDTPEDVSPATTKGETNSTTQGSGHGTAHNSPQIDSTQGDSEAGDSPPAPAGESQPGSDSAREETAAEVRSRVWGRLGREKRDLQQLGRQRDEMMKLAKKSIKDREERLKWVYSEFDRLYPPLGGADEGKTHIGQLGVTMSPPPVQKPPENAHSGSDDGQIQGLSTLPDGWPDLPANDSLAAEVGWVQAKRLRIVEERPGKATLVHLDRAMSAAPSWAALGWLETSIRSYAKFVDVAAKVTASSDDEGTVMKRERMAIEEMRGLLGEMIEDEGPRCQHCGYPARS